MVVEQIDALADLLKPSNGGRCGPEVLWQSGAGCWRYGSMPWYCYCDKHGSYRFVAFAVIHGQEIPVAGLQVVAADGVPHVVCNVYTHPEYRRRGLATMLYRAAMALLPDAKLSHFRSDDGVAWCGAITTPAVRHFLCGVKLSGPDSALATGLVLVHQLFRSDDEAWVVARAKVMHVLAVDVKDNRPIFSPHLNNQEACGNASDVIVHGLASLHSLAVNKLKLEKANHAVSLRSF